jgi:hypothetical protein
VKRAQIAKLTRPRLHRVVAREVLFRKLDEKRIQPVVWISGPPGAVSLRERLRGRFVRAVRNRSQVLETAGRHEEAIDLYERGIEIHYDFVGGMGPHRGHFLEDGEQVYGTFEGAVKTVAGQDGSWKSTWEGTYRYVGGTGKYKNIKGTGKYKGSIGSKEPFHEEGKETIEY